MMHPWMIEQVAEEHRRDLLDQACRTPSSKPVLRKRLARRSRRA